MRKIQLLEKFVMEVILSEINDSDRRIDRLVQSFVDGSINKPSFGDYALAKSSERRKEWLQQWRNKDAPRVASVPGSVGLGVSPGSVREATIKKVMKTMVLAEQQTGTPPVPDETADQPTNQTNAPTTPGGAPATPAPGTPPPTAGTDPNAPPVPGVPGGTTAGAVDPTTGAPLDPNAAASGMPGADATTSGGGIGGLGGGLGGFGGGPGGGGGGGDLGVGGDTTQGGDTDTSTAGGGDEDSGGDPVSKIVDDAKDLLDQTRDIPTILKSVKAVIQDKFDDPTHALGLVRALYDTGDSTLKNVAARLFQFIKSTEKG